MRRMHFDVTQNGDEWDSLRLGRFTASSFVNLFSGPKTATFEKAIYTPVYERLTGESPDRFYNEHMRRGHDLEPFAIEQYELDHFVEIQNGGFWSIGEWVGASPDGLIGSDGLFESKAPAYNTHINYLLNRELPKQYFWQVHGQLYVTDRAWCDFYSFHPELEPLLIRVHRDEKTERELIQKLDDAIDKASTILEKLIR